jgi:putative peptide-modifying radical SAM enzyme
MNEPHPDLPLRPAWNTEDLINFLSEDSSPTICFYGGEPLLETEKIFEIMDKIDAIHYTLQTNGLLLNKLPTKYLNRFSTILVSIDGDQKTTDINRGKGTYDKLLANIQDIRSRGFSGDLIARMAISETSTIYEDVVYLIESEELSFDHVHWQLDVQWDEGIETRWRNFPSWMKNYNEGITKLVDYWLGNLEKGKIRGLVPFLGIFRHIINDRSTDLPCEAGLRSFAIRTDGKITFCPLPPEYEFSIVGDIKTNTSNELENVIGVGKTCLECEVYNLCGGRCLFAEKTKLWGDSGFDLVCETVKHLINELKRIRENIEELIKNGIVKKADFEYPKYNNTTEIIP